jgi:hypothetical protein
MQYLVIAWQKWRSTFHGRCDCDCGHCERHPKLDMNTLLEDMHCTYEGTTSRLV